MPSAPLQRSTTQISTRSTHTRLQRTHDKDNHALIKAILWDMDGTLIESESLHLATLVEALAQHGVEAGDELHPLVFGKTGREVHALVRERFGLSVDFSEWSAFRARAYLNGAPRLVPRPGALEVYRKAKAAGMTQAIVSNASRMLLEANLRSLGIEDPSLITVSVNDVRHGKPSPEPYERAAWLLRLAPEEVVAVEDSPTGAGGAIAANMRVIGWPVDDAAAALFPPEAHIVRSPDELAAELGLNAIPLSKLPEMDR
jgi:HAD superfamily hydrolase (TIGR01509 family)